MPWNFPLVMAVWKLAPALAMGNSVVLKPASNTPLTALRLAELLDETDLPKGVVNVITGGGATVGEELASHPDVDKVSFTGSTVVGRRIMQLASSTIKKCTLELGGKSPNIVYEDANIEAAVDGALWATFFHQGQVCESGTRLLLPESIHDEFVERLVERAKGIKIGDALDYDSDMGPLVSAEQFETVSNYVRIGQEEGAKLVLGGGRPADAPEGGHYFEPTIFTDVDNSMTIAQEEIFGPVLSVIKFKNDKEAIEIANDSIYGLASAVWSEDYDRCLETARKLRAGTVWINDHHLINCIAPVRRLQAVGARARAGHLRHGRVHRGQARARGPHARSAAQDVRRAAVGVASGLSVSETAATAPACGVARCASTICFSVAFAVCLGFQPSCFWARSVFISTGLRTLWIQAVAAGSGSRCTTSAVASTARSGTGTEYQPSASARSLIVSVPRAARL